MALRQALLLLITLAVPLSGQEAHYRLSPLDTLRYREVTKVRVDLSTSQEPVQLTNSHDATIALAAERHDTVKAWYERLSLMSASPKGELRPETNGALQVPFRLILAPNGELRTASAPEFSDDIRDVTDLARQFEDFLISLPRSPLRPGVTWADTVRNATTGSITGNTTRGVRDSTYSRHIRRYHALRDTVVPGGITAMVIAVEQEIIFSNHAPMKDPSVIMDVNLSGREEGTAVFAPASARLLSRIRRGHLTGTNVFRGNGREVRVPMTYEYASTLNWISGARDP